MLSKQRESIEIYYFNYPDSNIEYCYYKQILIQETHENEFSVGMHHCITDFDVILKDFL